MDWDCPQCQSRLIFDLRRLVFFWGLWVIVAIAASVLAQRDLAVILIWPAFAAMWWFNSVKIKK